MESQIPRIRDFIETKEGLIFAAVSYYHPPERYNAFLRYYPDEKGDRKKEGKSYRKVASTDESFTFLKKDFPEYISDYSLQGVPKERLSKLFLPMERLKEITTKPASESEERIAALSEIFTEVSEEKKGVTGSFLLGLNTPASDIDFVVYGLDNFHRARDILGESFESEGRIRPLNEVEWKAAYEKRFGLLGELGFSEFVNYEQRKKNRGVIENTPFDILFVRDWGEIGGHPETRFERLGRRKIRCTVTDASLSFDSPAIYKVKSEDLEIEEVISFTHTYAGQAFEGEEIEVSGVLEKVMGTENYLRVIVGTTREAKGEYIKVHTKEKEIS